MDSTVRLLYKGLSRKCDTLAKEWKRGDHVLKLSSEIELLSLPFSMSEMDHIAHSAPKLKERLQFYFRSSPLTPLKLSHGFEMYKTLSHRAKVLAKMVYVPSSVSEDLSVYVEVEPLSGLNANVYHPSGTHYTFTYNITIKNHSDIHSHQITGRRWKIVDANGRVQTPGGEGIAGQKPILRPGEEYTYTSSTHIGTSHGFMVGHFIVKEIGTMREWHAHINAFGLCSPAPAEIDSEDYAET